MLLLFFPISYAYTAIWIWARVAVAFLDYGGKLATFFHACVMCLRHFLYLILMTYVYLMTLLTVWM